MIRSLQSFRGVFAIGIFITHCSAVLDLGFLPSGGDSGVAFFYMLSGFVMTLGYGEKIVSEAFDYRLYGARRIIRFWPMHILVLCVYILMNFDRLTTIDYVHLIPNLLLLQSWWSNPDVYFSGNGPAWALSDLVFFCALLPLVLRILYRRPRIFLALMCLGIVGYVLYISSIPSEHMFFLVYVLPPARLPDYVIGVLLAQLYQSRKMLLNDYSVNILQLLAIGSVCGASVYFTSIPEVFGLASWWWLPVALTIWIFTLTDGRGCIGRLLCMRPLVLLGDISFVFYLIHMPVCVLLKRAFVSSSPESWPYFFILLTLTISLVLSWMLWRFFERPVSSVLLCRFAKGNSKPFVNDDIKAVE